MVQWQRTVGADGNVLTFVGVWGNADLVTPGKRLQIKLVISLTNVMVVDLIASLVIAFKA